ncbi:hypothetical protein ACA910_015365 [Epithemia clementina (nom. ined.)]
MREIGYSSIAIVLETWDAARFHHGKDFDSEFGHKAVQRMFTVEPRTKSVFGFNKSESIGQSHVDVHAKAFPGLMDSVIQMLGPDVEFIEEILVQVGQRHKAMNVKPSFFPFMGKALILTVEEYLNRPLTNLKRNAWEEVYDEISQVIIKTILS